MKKIIFIILTLLMVSLSQVFGQKAPVPPKTGAKLLYSYDFGSDNTTSKLEHTGAEITSLMNTDNWTTNLTPHVFSATQPDNSYFTIAKITTNAPFGAWYKNYKDHTYGDGTHGYMLVVNASKKADIFFEKTIPNKCPNTRIMLRAYVGNLINQSYNSTIVSNSNYRADPWLYFIVSDPAGTDPNLPQESAPQRITKAAANTWTPITMEFTTGNEGNFLFQISDTVTNTNGNDFVLDDIEVWMVSPTVTINGSHSYCVGDKLSLVANTVDDTGTFSTPTVHWKFSPDNVTWEDLGTTGNTLEELAREGWYMAVFGSADNMGSVCSVNDIIQVNVAPKNSTLYWKPTGGVNQDWTNVSNWEDVNGSPVSFYPTECVDVHIPGNAERYPLLSTLPTAGDSLACHDIWFHFGGLIGQPHLLKYHYAYVQYNFGMSDGSNNDKGYAGNVNTLNNVLFSTTPMNRGQWYALAAPLQKIASGDFAIGGYPKTWQQGFMASSIQKSGANDGTWYTPVNTDDWDVGLQYNAIAIWAGESADLGLLGEGPDFQTNLNGLKGILEMPYFENNTIIPFHTEFYHSGGTSYFPYFYNQLKTPGNNASGFKPTGAYGSMQRGPEAYRFIIEGPPFTKAAGTNVYTMAVPANTEIMVGNPFFSNLDFNAFKVLNPGVTSYRLYVNNNYAAYGSTAGVGNWDDTNPQYIAPLQAFFITTPSSGTLKFDADNIAMANEPGATKLRSSNSSNGNTKADVLYMKAESPAGKSYLTLSMQEVNEKNLILLLPDGYPEVPQIYATDQTGQKNAIQFEGGYVKSVPLGILSTDNAMVTLTVQNAANMAVDSLILWDQYLNKKVNLKTADTYTFKNVPSVSDRFTLLVGNKVITGITAPQANNSVRANISGNTLYVSAASQIADVSVISLQGVKISTDVNIGKNTYTKAMNLPTGAYLVSVKLATGETKVVKIVNP